MINVVIIGFGNVGSHLNKALSKCADIAVVQIYSRSMPSYHSDQRMKFTNQLSEVIQADLYLLAVPDDVISSISSQLPFEDRLVAHVSGAAAMEVIDPKNRRAVFYPLQSFTKNRALDYDDLPICIEAEQSQDLELIRTIATSISSKVEKISSEDRVQLHMAAVFVNNYVNHLYHISETLLAEKGLNFDLLLPLIMETAKKMQDLTPLEAQTGPALRNDTKTMEKHLSLLTDPKLKKIYRYFSQAIQSKNQSS